MLPFPSFAWAAPRTLGEAVALLAEPGSVAVAGGTDLLPSLKHRLSSPRRVVSLARIPELRGVSESARILSIGAATTLREVARAVAASHPALAAACRTVATPTIQGMGTLGGNLLLDTRCVYYNQPEGWRASIGGCLKCEGSVCHVAPRGKGCYAAHSADTVPALWLMGARVELASAEGTRTLEVREMYRQDGIARLALRPGEVLTRVLLPGTATGIAHRKGRTRAAIDYGWLLVAVERRGDGYRAVVGAVAPAPIQIEARTPELLAEAAFRAVQPLGTHLQAATWRKRMVRVEVRRAAETL